MNTTVIISLVILLGIIFWVFAYMYMKIESLKKSLESYQESTNGAFRGVYFKINEMNGNFASHFHHYVFEDGVLYIQDPICEGREIDENLEIGNEGEDYDYLGCSCQHEHTINWQEKETI